MLQLMKNYVKSRGAWVDAVLLNDSSIPDTPAVTSCGPVGFQASQLRFRAEPYQGKHAFAAVKWRMAEITPVNRASKATPPAQGLREITAVWESPELAEATAEVAIPGGVAQPGHTYRVRARMKDNTGRWSHWSAPVEFLAQ